MDMVSDRSADGDSFAENARHVITEDPILVAVNLEDASDKQILWACKYAQYVGAEVLILHVVHDPATAPGFYRKSTISDDVFEPMESIAERMLAKLLDTLRANHLDLAPLQNAKFKIITGLPENRIVEFARIENPQLIVLGHRKRTGLQKYFKSSVAGQVMQNVIIPTVIFNQPSENLKEDQKKN